MAESLDLDDWETIARVAAAEHPELSPDDLRDVAKFFAGLTDEQRRELGRLLPRIQLAAELEGRSN